MAHALVALVEIHRDSRGHCDICHRLRCSREIRLSSFPGIPPSRCHILGVSPGWGEVAGVCWHFPVLIFAPVWLTAKPDAFLAENLSCRRTPGLRRRLTFGATCPME